MKPTILLAITLFLISAPAPDSNDIAELTSNFLVPQEVPGLLASEEVASKDMALVRNNVHQILPRENLIASDQLFAANTDLKIQSAKD